MPTKTVLKYILHKNGSRHHAVRFDACVAELEAEGLYTRDADRVMPTAAAALRCTWKWVDHNRPVNRLSPEQWGALFR